MPKHQSRGGVGWEGLYVCVCACVCVHVCVHVCVCVVCAFPVFTNSCKNSLWRRGMFTININKRKSLSRSHLGRQ